MFWLKKFITFWIMPLQACTLLVLIGWLLTRTKRHQRLGRIMIGTGVGLLLLAANNPVSNFLIHSIEGQYDPVPELVAGAPLPPKLAACKYIVVLGGGHSGSKELPATIALSGAAGGRLTEGLRLSRALPEAKLIVTGAGAPGRPSHASVLARAAVSMGLPRERILTADTPRDTENEAIELKTMIGPDVPFALVTSASHMPRAMGLMRRQGLTPLACPTDFQSKPSEESSWRDWFFSLDALQRTTSAAYERIGYLWAWARGKI